VKSLFTALFIYFNYLSSSVPVPNLLASVFTFFSRVAIFAFQRLWQNSFVVINEASDITR
jgi:hypothetical protein